MTGRLYTRLAWALWGVVMFFAVASLVLRFLNGSAVTSSLQGADYLAEIVWWDVLVPAAIPAYATIGAVVASRRPENAVGWLCLALGALIAVTEATWEYAARAFEVAPGSLPFGTFAAWISGILSPVVVMPFVLILLLFPDGRLPSRRWRLAVWTILAGAGLEMLSGVVGPEVRPGLNTDIPNPTRFEGLEPVVGAASVVWPVVFLAMLLVSVASVFVRWRRAGGNERQQLKWLAYSGGIVAAAMPVGLVSAYVSGTSYATFLAFSVCVAGVTLGVPAAIGIAILRHRLYDVDLLINRTMVYTLLTASLALVYVGGVVLLQGLLRVLTVGAGFESAPTLAVVASTLVIAALFGPLRHRIQVLIDRRFYRQKYDAARTLEALSARLRDETDLDSLGGDLVGAVNETLQPEHASLWLRTLERPR